MSAGTQIAVFHGGLPHTESRTIDGCRRHPAWCQLNKNTSPPLGALLEEHGCRTLKWSAVDHLPKREENHD